jgi:hypothetical protein
LLVGRGTKDNDEAIKRIRSLEEELLRQQDLNKSIMK